MRYTTIILILSFFTSGCYTTLGASGGGEETDGWSKSPAVATQADTLRQARQDSLQSQTVTVAQMQSYKDPDTAQLISILLTGGGRLYAGETNTGALLLGIGVLTPAAGIFMSTPGETHTERVQTHTYNCGAWIENCPPDEYEIRTTHTEPDLKPMWVGVGVGLAAWVYSVADAADAARRHNREAGIALRPVVGRRPGLAVQVGL